MILDQDYYNDWSNTMEPDGYYQVLCHNGHLHHWPVYSFDKSDVDDWECMACGMGLAWKNLVDAYNGQVDLKMKTKAKYCRCKCGNKHVVSPPIFEIPEE